MSADLSPLQFAQSSQESALYVATGGEATHIWCAYVLPANQKPIGSSLTLTQVNQTGGYMVLAPKAPTSTSATDLATFVQQVRSCAQQLNPKTAQLGLMWLLDPNAVNTATVAAACWLRTPNPSAPNSLFLQQVFSFSFGNNLLTLTLPDNAYATVTATDNGLYNFYVPAATAPAAASTPQLLYNAQGQAATASVVTYFTVSLTGPAAGRLMFGAGFDTAQIAQFNVGMQYYYPSSDNSGGVTTLAYPMFSGGQSGKSILADVSLDVFNLLSQPRVATAPSTYIAFNGLTQPTKSAPTVPTVLPTSLLTSGGYPVTLQPTGDVTTDSVTGLRLPGPLASLVVFSNQVPQSASAPWAMVPSGSYVLGATEPAGFAGPWELMCGLAGTEVISFTPQADATLPLTGDYLVFQPGGSAYAPGFGAAAATSAVTTLLTSQYTTAWATVVPGTTGAPSYYAQPQGAELYGGAASTTNFLPYFRSAAALLPAMGSVFFPLGTYGNTSLQSTASLLEGQVLSPARRAALGALAKSAYSHAASTTTATTFQGLFVETDANNASNWQRVVLAQAPNPDGNAISPQTLAFAPPGETLQAALQTNQLFLVMSANPGGAADGLTSATNTINMEGWPFTLALPTQNPYGQFSNVLIFKYCAGTLQDLLGQPALWAQAGQFNFGTAADGFCGLVGWLQDYVSRAVSRAGAGDQEYDHFASIVTQENWQGILGLRVSIGLQDFPAGLDGLLAGIDLSRFAAHHFGIEANVITLVEGQPQLMPSSAMFGLIDYEDPEFAQLGSSPQQYQNEAPVQTSSAYSFKVLSLKVLFQNSKIQSYNSYLALTINQLFGAAVLPANRQNLLVLAGSYEDHDHHPVYAFNSLPSTAGGGYRLNLAAGVDQEKVPPALQAVELVKATFSTSVTSVEEQSTVAASFMLWGYLDFAASPGFDLLSYGNEVGATIPQTGLCFANLVLEMSFPLLTPLAVTFTLDTQQLSFDLSQSTARANSLARKFPVKLQALLAGNSSSLPSSQSYLPVELLGLTTAPTVSTGPWYGLRFALDMGTLGDLAGAVGFTAQLLLVWNPDGTLAPAGLLLPGVNPQAPFFSLQGILRLDISSVQLMVATSPSATGATNTAYLLKLNDIALKLFSLSFPPGGSVNFFLLGDPNATDNPQSLGWYTAYQASAAAQALPAATTSA